MSFTFYHIQSYTINLEGVENVNQNQNPTHGLNGCHLCLLAAWKLTQINSIENCIGIFSHKNLRLS